MGLSPDQTDAVLRDTNVPSGVRATVLADYDVKRYLDTVEFYEDENGVTHTRPAPDPDSEPAQSADVPATTPAAVPGQDPAPPVPPATTASPATADTPVPPPAGPSEPAQAPADVTTGDVTPVADADGDGA